MLIVRPGVKFVALTVSVEELDDDVRNGELEFSGKTTSELLESIGRTCYKSEDKITPGSADAFLEHLLAQDPPHESVIEHVYAGFRIVADRGVSHELVRHRIASYSQESTRFCNYTKDKFGREISVLQPPGLDDETFAIWRRTVEFCEQGYFMLVERGVPPQIARSVLPTCLKTEVVATLNLRSWRNFLEQRLSPKAHPQMREIAEMVRDRLAKVCPPCFKEFTTVAP